MAGGGGGAHWRRGYESAFHPRESAMPDDIVRGSSKLMAAWKARAVSEEAFREIAASFEKSMGRIERAEVVGGESASGVSLTVSYSGDDVPTCGNDILFWLKWHRK